MELYSGFPSRVSDFKSPSSLVNERPLITSLKQFTVGTIEAKYRAPVEVLFQNQNVKLKWLRKRSTRFKSLVCKIKEASKLLCMGKQSQNYLNIGQDIVKSNPDNMWTSFLLKFCFIECQLPKENNIDVIHDHK